MKFRFIITLFAALFLAGCSSQEEVGETPADDNLLERFGADGYAYLNLNIDLGSLAEATRADNANDLFADATEAEYAVYNARLILFHGDEATDAAKENDLKVCSTYNLSSDNFTTSGDTGSQRQRQLTQRISWKNLSTSDHLYALILLNNTEAIKAGDKFVDVKAKTVAYGALTPGIGLAMANAPVSNKDKTHVSTLVEIDQSKIYTEATAAHTFSTAATINVERAAAKITLEWDGSDTKKYIEANPALGYQADDLAFAVVNYNDKGFLTRHFDDTWLNTTSGYHTGFVGTTLRTYWGEDINYTGLSPALKLNTAASVKDEHFNPLGTAAYCAENTFDVAHMTHDHTTHLIIRLKIYEGDFYTTSLTGPDDVMPTIQSTTPGSEHGTTPDHSLAPHRSATTRADGQQAIEDFLRSWLMSDYADHATLLKWLNDNSDGNPAHLQFEWGTVDDDGVITVEAVTTDFTPSTTAKSAFDALKLHTAINSGMTIHLYKKGYCYYRVPVRHFYNDYTEWKGDYTMNDKTGTADIYKAKADGTTTAEMRYLGRYGVVRNNWYHVYVDRILHVGAPTIQQVWWTGTGIADDAMDEMILMKMSTLPWATHNQPVGN